MAFATCLATSAERHHELPADGIVPDSVFTSTHAVTIDAPPEAVWRSIAQMGAGRAAWIVRGRASSHWLDLARAPIPAGQHRIFIEGAYAVLARLPRPLLIAFARAGHRIMEARRLRGIQRRSTATTRAGARVERWRKPLLTGGILAGLLYVAMTLLVGMLWDSYSTADQTISELSAIGAPTRSLWMTLGLIYSALMMGFSWTVWKSAANRGLRTVGALLLTQTVFGVFWPPMHQRAVLAAGGGTMTDTLHIVWAVVTSLFFMVALGLGAVTFGKRFRVYSLVTMAIVFACGAWTGTYAPAVQANTPTPWVGVWERINTNVFMLWVVVLALTLRRNTRREAGDVPTICVQDDGGRSEVPCGP